MSKAKYTPGPWFVDESSTHGQYVSKRDGNGAFIVAETYPDENQDFEANAALIAAAPEMLEQITEISKWLDNGWLVAADSRNTDEVEYFKNALSEIVVKAGDKS